MCSNGNQMKKALLLLGLLGLGTMLSLPSWSWWQVELSIVCSCATGLWRRWLRGCCSIMVLLSVRLQWFGPPSPQHLIKQVKNNDL
uniref:Uncharacterized protein n=1 Tax=Arundo donax TaxID=35708 RepID=A0A0A9BVR5_ARUDO